jgi:hypothetical protein
METKIEKITVVETWRKNKNKKQNMEVPRQIYDDDEEKGKESCLLQKIFEKKSKIHGGVMCEGQVASKNARRIW